MENSRGGGRVKVIEFQGSIPKFEKEFPDFINTKKWKIPDESW